MMKKTILMLAALAGVAYYLHWFNFTTSGTGSNEHINITFDKAKIQQDEVKAVRVLKQEEQRIQQDAAQAGPADPVQPAYDPNQQSAGETYDPNQQSAGPTFGPSIPPSGAPAYDPYDSNPPAAAPQPRYVPPRSAKRPPPSDLDRGFE
jgi:hypothetical protein